MKSLIELNGDGFEVYNFGEGIYMGVDEFSARFGTDHSYNSLINRDAATNAWKDIFNRLEKKGILN